MTGFGEWLLSILQQILQFFADVVIAVADWLWQAVLNLISSNTIIGVIEVAGGLFESIDPSVWYFMSIFQIPYGITVVLGAYVLRFIIRRIPFIG
ncbi:DUF2523 family protein [Pseudomonas protegens]|uniref:DUF2523 family protein n=1 Tax=Pseudomonas protegens TaxID=380021 RepID=UPI002769A609|nr:DUF2523 family protein [Pseudomonas protegens]MDP9530879.1 DUF2523 family protein [Pseudomonas protegens]